MTEGTTNKPKVTCSPEARALAGWLDFAHKWAHRFLARCPRLRHQDDDAHAVALLALTRAAAVYDPAGGAPWPRYAAVAILRHLQRWSRYQREEAPLEDWLAQSVPYREEDPSAGADALALALEVARTPGERRVVRLLAEGHKARHVAAEMGVARQRVYEILATLRERARRMRRREQL